MNKLPFEIKLTYIIAVIIMIVFVGFIVLLVYFYNRKQFYFLKEKQLKQAEHQNEILQKELERQQSIQLERERISHDMHDDLGAGISALKLQTEFLKEKLKHDENLQKDLDDLLKTSADMNLSMREMLWNLNKTNDTLQRLVQYISSYAENFFSKTRIKLFIENNLSSIDVPIPSQIRWHIFLCIKESLNNIYKHSKASSVTLKFEQMDKQFILEIKDDGIGLQNTQNSGNGFKNIIHRMEESCGKFEILPSEKGLHLKFYLQI